MDAGRLLRLAAHACLAACAIWIVSTVLLASARDESGSTPASATQRADADFSWQPALAPAGPVVLVVSISEQRAHVYRNGVRIGLSAVSTGRPGFETPAGVFRVLQKRREHYSNRYDNAPMPFMQRLTWTGVALHAGHVPDYPASHGCIRLPYEFAKWLFALTHTGMIVVVAGHETAMSSVSQPGFFAPVDATSGASRAFGTMSDEPYVWNPELAPTGPLNVVVGTRDGLVVAIRDGEQIGRAALQMRGEPMSGSRLYLLLEGQEPGLRAAARDRPARHWLGIPLPNVAVQPSWHLDSVLAERRLEVDPEFARLLYDALQPGTTLLITDEALGTAAQQAPIPILSTGGENASGVPENLR